MLHLIPYELGSPIQMILNGSKRQGKLCGNLFRIQAVTLSQAFKPSRCLNLKTIWLCLGNFSMTLL